MWSSWISGRPAGKDRPRTTERQPLAASVAGRGMFRFPARTVGRVLPASLRTSRASWTGLCRGASVGAHHAQHGPARGGQREHLRRAADPVAGCPPQLDLVVAGDREHGEHGQPPGALPLVGADSEAGAAGVPGQPAVAYPGAERGGHLGHRVRPCLGPPRFLQGDDVRLQPVARLRHVEGCTVAGCPHAGSARQRDRAGRPGPG